PRVVVGARCKAEYDLGRCRCEAPSQSFGVLAFAGRGRVRDVALALPGEREQRIGPRRRGPAIGRKTGHPQRIESETGAFEETEDLNRRGAAFGLKSLLGRKRVQRGKRARRREPRRNRTEAREFHEQSLPRL